MLKLTAILSCALSLILLFIGLSNYNEKEYDPIDFKNREYGNFFYDKALREHVPVNLKNEQEKLIFEEAHKKRFVDYKENRKSLAAYIQLLSVFIIIGLLILFYMPSMLKIPVIGIDLPIELLFPSVIIGLVYLWLQFGLNLNSGIDSRLAITSSIEMQETIGNKRVSHVYSEVNNLVDKSILDTWCHYYYKDFKRHDVKDEKGSLDLLTRLGLFGVYATFIGLIHGVCLILISSYYEFKRHSIKIILYAVVFLLFILSDYSFLDDFRHSIFFITFLWFIISMMILWWLFFGKNLAERIRQKLHARRLNKV